MDNGEGMRAMIRDEIRRISALEERVGFKDGAGLFIGI